MASAARSKRGDLTQGSIGSTLLKFALPTLASSILQSLNGTINAIWVGRFIGEGALAATSNANMVMFLLTAFVFGFGMASTILIAIAGYYLAGSILALLGTPAQAAPLALARMTVEERPSEEECVEEAQATREPGGALNPAG